MKCRPRNDATWVRHEFVPRTAPFVTKDSSTRLRAARVADHHNAPLFGSANDIDDVPPSRFGGRHRRVILRESPRRIVADASSTTAAGRPHPRRTQCGVGGMSALSRAVTQRGTNSCRTHVTSHARATLHGWPFPGDDTPGRGTLSSAFLLPTFLWQGQRKVGAAPHRGNANRPQAKQGKAKNPGTWATPIDRKQNKGRPKTQPHGQRQ